MRKHMTLALRLIVLMLLASSIPVVSASLKNSKSMDKVERVIKQHSVTGACSLMRKKGHRECGLLPIQVWAATLFAIQLNMMDEAYFLLKFPGCMINTYGQEEKKTLLACAIEKNNVALVEKLLSMGAIVESIGDDGKNTLLDSEGHSILDYTRHSSSAPYSEQYVDDKKRILSMLYPRINPLSLPLYILEASFSGNNYFLDFMVSNGVSLAGIVTNNNITPLMSAILGGHRETVRLLCDNGLDPNVTWEELGKGNVNYLDLAIGQACLPHSTRLKDYLEVLDFLCTKVTDIKKSVVHAQSQEVKAILEAHIALQDKAARKAEKNAKRRKKEKEKRQLPGVGSALPQEPGAQADIEVAAVEAAIVNCIKKELDKEGTDSALKSGVHARSSRAKRPVSSKTVTIEIPLVGDDGLCGADNAGDVKKIIFSALCVLILQDTDEEIFLWNLEQADMHGVDINKSELDDGSTLLMFAVGAGKVKMVEMLLEKGALPECKNKAKRTAFSFARPELKDTKSRKAELFSIIKMMLPGVRTRNSDALVDIFFDAIATGNNYVMHVMKDEGFSVETRNAVRYTSLLYAIMKGRPNAVRFLYKNGANIHELACVDTTYLAVAVNIGSRKDVAINPDRKAAFASIARFLCEKGISLDNALGDVCTKEMEELVNFYRTKREQEEKENLCLEHEYRAASIKMAKELMSQEQLRRIQEAVVQLGDRTGIMRLVKYRERKERARRAREIQLLRGEELAQRALRIQEAKALKDETQLQYRKAYERAERENACREHEYRAASIKVAKELALQEQACRIQEAVVQVDDRTGMLQLVKYWEHEERARRVKEVRLLQESEQELATQREERAVFLCQVKIQEEQERVRRMQEEYERKGSSASAVLWGQTKDAQAAHDAQELPTNIIIYLLGEIEKRADLRQKLCIAEPVMYAPDLFSVFLKHQEHYSRDMHEFYEMIATISPGYKKRAKEGRLLHVSAGVYTGYELLFMAENSI